jgi:hypothetical protein
MTKKELIDFAEHFFTECIETMEKKNSDYTGASKTSDPFANFRATETFGVSTEVGFVTRLTDKFSRLASFVKKGELEVKNESVHDTIQDAVNYLVLLSAYLHSKK